MPEYFLLATLKKLRLVGSQWDGPVLALVFLMWSYFLGFLLPSHSRITLARVVGRPRAWWHHVPSGAFAHRLFFGVFFSTGIPTSRYFLAASNRGWEARRPDLARKFARMGARRLGRLRVFWLEYPLRRISWRRRTGAGRPNGPIQLENTPEWGLGGRRLDAAGMITPPPAAPGTRADEDGWPSQGFLYGCLFLPKVEPGLKSRNNGLSGPTGVVPTLGGLQ